MSSDERSAPGAGEPAGPRWRAPSAVAGLLLVTAAAYVPALRGEFLLDDPFVLQDPLVVRPFEHGPGAWLASARPLATFTFALDHLAAGLDPLWWHVTSVAVHLGAVLLALAFARLTLARAGLARPFGPALAAAGLFALHPLQTEAVAYLTQRAESLASALYLAGLLLLLARDEASGRRRAALLAAAVAVHAAGLLAKPVVATLPAAWLLHAAVVPVAAEAHVPAWRRVARRLPAALPLLALSAASAAHGLSLVAGTRHTGFSIPDLSPADYAATQLRVVPTYLRLLALPAGQCADWQVAPSRGFLEPAVIAGALLLAALLGAAAVAAARGLRRTGDGAAVARVAGFGAPFFLLALTPTSSVVPLLDLLAEHRTYLAALGPFLAVTAAAALALRRALPSRAGLAGAALAATVLAAAGALTAARAAVWTSPLAFWGDAAAKSPGKARVQLNLGYALFGAGRPAEALEAFRRAGALRDGTLEPATLLENVVTTLLALRRIEDARAEVGRVLEADPSSATPFALLAQIEFVDRRGEHAARAALAALARDPRQTTALKYLGLARASAGDAAGALAAFRAAAALHVLDPLVFAELGVAEERAGTRPAACAAYARAAAMAPGAPSAAAARAALARLRCR